MPLQHVRRFLAQTGGIQRRQTRRRIQHLTMAEREEISRGLAAGSSARTIATGLNRSPSTIAREIARNGGAGALSASGGGQSAGLSPCATAETSQTGA
ncbi:helix-turn-helix domain-containing protein [Nocardia salmonicida]|uniref:helix-turn-helix domain-containing protein n=1 Tax=Nocardia salmonicida TaxID=53431 RepID=UPI0039A70DF3